MASGNEPKYMRTDWIQAVDELVSGVQELISESGELNLYTSEIRLADLRRMADRVLGVEADSELQNKAGKGQWKPLGRLEN